MKSILAIFLAPSDVEILLAMAFTAALVAEFSAFSRAMEAFSSETSTFISTLYFSSADKALPDKNKPIQTMQAKSLDNLFLR